MGNITISKSSGQNDGTFTIAAKNVNNTVNDITSTVKVTNGDGRFKTVTFVQKGRNKATGLSADDITIVNHQQASIDTVVTPSDALYNLEYSSADPSIATVSANGTVTGVGPGTTTITITDTVSGKSTTIQVTVTAVGYTVTKTASHATISGADSINEGETYTATVSADTGYDISAVTVTMGGTTVPGAYANGQINVPNVSGNITITVTTTQHVFDVTPTTITVEYNDTTAQTVSVSSNAAWTVVEQ